MMKKVLLMACLSVILTAGLASATYQVGDEIGDFTLNDSEGNSVSLSDFDGKVVFIFFWESG
ncbi:peroxiredoxin family protein [bacterium]|nr:peroxiredoxin family protein [bacterium]